MFEVKFFVDDKKLSTVLHALDGLTLDLRVTPVVGARSAAGGVVEDDRGPGRPSKIALLAGMITKDEGSEITRQRIRELMKQVGMGPTASSYAIKQLINRKVIKNTKVRSSYSITR